MTTLTCPYIKDCRVYQKLSETFGSGDPRDEPYERLDVIVESRTGTYSCDALVLLATSDHGNNNKSRFAGNNPQCLHLESLNATLRLIDKLSHETQ